MATSDTGFPVPPNWQSMGADPATHQWYLASDTEPENEDRSNAVISPRQAGRRSQIDGYHNMLRYAMTLETGQDWGGARQAMTVVDEASELPSYEGWHTTVRTATIDDAPERPELDADPRPVSGLHPSLREPQRCPKTFGQFLLDRNKAGVV
jgi:hypothetical protein